MAVEKSAYYQNNMAMLQARNDMIKDEMLAVAKMTDASFDKIDAFCMLVMEFPEESYRLRHLVHCKKIRAEAISEINRLGQQIGMTYELKKKPRSSTIFIYRWAVADALALAAKESPAVLLGMIFGTDEAERMMRQAERPEEPKKPLGDLLS